MFLPTHSATRWHHTLRIISDALGIISDALGIISDALGITTTTGLNYQEREDETVLTLFALRPC